MQSYSLTHLADHALRKELISAVSARFAADANELARLAEFEGRKLFLPEGYSSMYDFCVGELGLSEDEALTRIRVARTAHLYPAIYALIQERRLTFTAVLRLAPQLTKENAAELLVAAAGKTISQLGVLLAERFPRPDLPERVHPIPVAGLAPEPAPAAIQQDELVSKPLCEASSQLVSKPVAVLPPQPLQQPARIAPLSPQRFGIQLTVGQPTHDKLRRAQSLLGHAVPNGDLEQVLDRALDALIAKLEKRRFGATSRPRKSRVSERPRHIPAEVKREVWRRDGDRCTFVSKTGHRCESRKGLELDHVVPVAKGGAATVANLRVRCRGHNQYAADRAFGTGFMDAKRQAPRVRAAARMGTNPAVPGTPRPAPAATEAQRDAALEVVPWLLTRGRGGEDASACAEP